MKVFRVFPIVLCAAMLFITMVPGARADQWDKKSFVTFNDPVAIPGQVLEPGTYVFKKLGSPLVQNIVQVWSEGEDQLLATIQTVPAYQSQANDKSVFRLDPLSSEPTMTLRSWFYAGDNFGQRFVYPEYPTTE